MNQKDIQTLIDTGSISQTGNIEWTGDNGLKAIVTYINKNTSAFGVKTVDTLTQLGLMSGEDANLVSVKGVGLYRFNPNASQALPTSIGGVNGIWMLETSYSATNKYQKTIGNGYNTYILIKHNLNNLYPNVTLWDITGVEPQLYNIGNVTVVSVDTNTIGLTFGVAPTLNQYLVNVQ